MKSDHQSDDPSIAQKPVPAAKLERTRHPVPVDYIEVNSDRFRKVSDEDINKIAESIRQNGLLHPIGVRIIPGGGKFQLIYGLSRLTATKKNGDNLIEAVIFQPNTTDDQAKMFEIAENYHRTELTPEERTEHMLKYAALLKKTGAVRSRREKQAKTQTKDDPNVAPCNVRSDGGAKPTVTEAITKEMGIDRTAVHKRTKKAIETAKAHGVDVDESATLETMEPEKLEEVADAVLKEPEPPPEPETAIDNTSTKSRDASNRRYLTDEVADDVRAALEPVWAKWCDMDDPDFDWSLFVTVIKRFLKTGVQN